MVVLQARNISCVRDSVTLLKAVDVDVSRGEVLGVIGANGSGKSTLVKLLTGYWPASTGDVLFDGRALRQWQRHELARRLACLPQNHSLVFPFTVEQVVALGRMPFVASVARNREVVAKAMRLMDLEHLTRRRYTELSGGEKQRTQLARVLAQVWPDGCEPRLLVLDEPFASLDPGHKRLLLDTLATMAGEGLATVLVEHELNLVFAVAGRVVALKSGQVVAQGRTGSIANTELLAQLFDADIAVMDNPHRPGTPLCTI